jgi:hypothetical protein
MLNVGNAFSVVNPLASEHVNICIKYIRNCHYIGCFVLGEEILVSHIKVCLRRGC